MGRRARAPTLAGQALEQEHHEAGSEIKEVQEDEGDIKEKRLARTFLVLRLPDSSGSGSGSARETTVPPPSRKGKEKAVNANGHENGSVRPSLSTSSSRSSVHSTTSSGRSTPTRDQTDNGTQRTLKANGHDRFKDSGSTRRRTDSVSSSISMRRIPTGPNGTVMDIPDGEDTHRQYPVKARSTPPIRDSIPFYVSPIHHPSTNPRFLQLEEGDFAPWLSVEESASDHAVLEVWYEDHDQDQNQNQKVKWRKLKPGIVGGEVNLGHLRRLEPGMKLGDNSVLITLATDPRSTYYLDPTYTGQGGASDAKTGARDAVERSRRETRMKKGIGLGGLHQYVEITLIVILGRRGRADR